MKLDKEYEKLADLEFEYNITRLYYGKDKVKMGIALSRYKKQLAKIKKLESDKDGNDDGEEV